MAYVVVIFMFNHYNYHHLSPLWIMLCIGVNLAKNISIHCIMYRFRHMCLSSSHYWYHPLFTVTSSLTGSIISLLQPSSNNWYNLSYWYHPLITGTILTILVPCSCYWYHPLLTGTSSHYLYHPLISDTILSLLVLPLLTGTILSNLIPSSHYWYHHLITCTILS